VLVLRSYRGNTFT